MRKNCSRKAYLKRVGAAVLAGTMLLAAMPGTAFAAYAPVTGNPEDTYDAEYLLPVSYTHLTLPTILRV